MAKGVPLTLSHNVKCNRALQQSVLLVAATSTEAPRFPEEERIAVTPISEGLTRAELRFGFMEQPNVPEGLRVAMARDQIPKFDLSKAIYPCVLRRSARRLWHAKRLPSPPVSWAYKEAV